jgi:hypothetical protein
MENKCIFCGPIRNCGPYLDKVLKNIELLGSLFDDYRIILFYDKSKDNTLNILKYYKQTNNKLFFYVNNKLVSPFRTYRIAYARNFCINEIRKNYNNYKYFIMMDFDDPNAKKCNVDILKKYLNRDDWDALSFNTRPTYYDIWGLSIYPYTFSYNHFEGNEKNYYIIQDYITNKLNNLKDGELLPCISSFNGFAIYKTNKFLNCSYNGKINLKLIPKHYLKAHMKASKSNIIFKDYGNVNGLFEDCEHRAFHVQSINKNNAKICISKDILFV